MAEKRSVEENRQELEEVKEELSGFEGTQQARDRSQGRVVTSTGKLRPLTALSTESGYQEDTCEAEQPLQAISELKNKMYNLCGSLGEFEEVMEIAATVHSDGKREGRREALDEVEQQRHACDQMQEAMGQFMQDTLERWEKLQQILTTLVPILSTGTATSGGHHSRESESIVYSQQSASVTRQSSGDSTTLSPKEEVDQRRQQRTTSSSAEPLSPTSSCSGETRFDTADEQREGPQSTATPSVALRRYPSSSDEETKCKGTGLELHPRKMLASRKKKGKM